MLRYRVLRYKNALDSRSVPTFMRFGAAYISENEIDCSCRCVLLYFSCLQSGWRRPLMHEPWFVVACLAWTSADRQLCVSKEEEMKESFKGKDMTYEQYEQLKQLNDSHGQGPKEDETDMKDTVDAAKRR